MIDLSQFGNLNHFANDHSISGNKPWSMRHKGKSDGSSGEDFLP